MSNLLDGEISHDQLTRSLASEELTSKDLWNQVKPIVRKIETDDGVLIFDDTVQEKPWMDEYDHCKSRDVKGINRLNCLYHANGVSIPVTFELIRKPIRFCDIKTRQEKRLS